MAAPAPSSSSLNQEETNTPSMAASPSSSVNQEETNTPSMAASPSSSVNQEETNTSSMADSSSTSLNQEETDTSSMADSSSSSLNKKETNSPSMAASLSSSLNTLSMVDSSSSSLNQEETNTSSMADSSSSSLNQEKINTPSMEVWSSSSSHDQEINTPSMAASSSSSLSSSYKPEIDEEIWQACAGYLVNIPKKDSLVYYFPQGHFEHVQHNSNSNSNSDPNPDSNPIQCGSFLCRVMNVSFLANRETDQVFVKFLLQPCITNCPDSNPDLNPDPNPDDPNRIRDNVVTFARILSDITKDFYYVVTSLRDSIFTRIPKNESQFIMLTDIHGNTWEFMLDSRDFFTYGWTKFVEAKNLTEGDSIVFIRKKSINDDNDDEYYIGIRRAVVNTGISVEDIEDAIEKAQDMESFEVVYYPIRGLPEFVVPKVKVDNALRTDWRHEMLVNFWHEYGMYGMPIKCRHTGTVLNIVHRENDMSDWPDSWWRVLQVEWHENPEVLEDMPNLEKNMSPWELQVYPSDQ